MCVYMCVCVFRTGNEQKLKKQQKLQAREAGSSHFFESVCEDISSVFRLLRSHLNSQFFSFMISQMANFLTYFIMCTVKLKYLL